MLYIIRHGQTEKNKAKLMQGRVDTPLNEEGERQAAEAAELFKKKGIRFDRVYSSPLKRAVRTAELAVCHADIVTDDRLLEMEYGPYEGMSLEDPAPEVMAFFQDFAGTPAPEGMEPLESVVARTGSFAEEIMQEAKNGNVLISTHAIAMKGLLEYLTPGADGFYWDKYIGNCEVYAAEVTDEGYGVPRRIFGLTAG